MYQNVGTPNYGGKTDWRVKEHTSTMASKRVFRACKLQGLALRADALQKLTDELIKYAIVYMSCLALRVC